MMKLLALMLLASAVSSVLLTQDEAPDRVKLRFEPQSGQILHTRTSVSQRVTSAAGKAIDVEVKTAFTERFDEVNSRDQFDADVVIEELTASIAPDNTTARAPEVPTAILGRHFKATFSRLARVLSVELPPGAESMEAEVKNIITEMGVVPMFETLFVDEPVLITSDVSLMPGTRAHLAVTTTLKSIKRDGPDYVGKMDLKLTGLITGAPVGPSVITVNGSGAAEWNIDHSFLRAFSFEFQDKGPSKVMSRLRMIAYLDGTQPPR